MGMAGEGGRVGGSSGGVGGAVGGQSFVDRSKVRILLCDSDPDSSQDVLRLLCDCSYQGQFTLPCLYRFLVISTIKVVFAACCGP